MGAVTYVVAKYTPDLLRQEPRNVGVVVANGAGAAARFVGEAAEESRLDLRRVPRDLFNDSRLYAEWHRYWRSLIERQDGGVLEVLLEDRPGEAFSVWWGGQSFPPADLSLQQTADDLFNRLVAEIPKPTVVEKEDLPTRSRQLAISIRSEFRRRNILAEPKAGGTLFAEHPVLWRAPVKGSLSQPHQPTFYQKNGAGWPMEQIDFRVRGAEAAREHAAYAAWMLDDLARSTQEEIRPIAIVNRAPGGGAEQEYGLEGLSRVRHLRMVHWDDELQRLRFLHEREELAKVRG